MESILTSVKKMVDIGEEYEAYDTNIIILINNVFMTLKQLGVGPKEGFFIEDETAVWTDFIEDVSKLQAVKTYVSLKVKILFDPNSIGASTLAAYERTIQELEWRLHVDVETEAFSGGA